jgi:hypothetical protein
MHVDSILRRRMMQRTLERELKLEADDRVELEALGGKARPRG